MKMSREAAPASAKPVRKIGAYLRWAFAILLLTLLLFYAGPRTLFHLAKDIKPWWALLSLCLTYSLIVVGGFNVWILLRLLSPIRLSSFLRIYMLSWAVGLLFPGQLGDASQVYLLKRKGVQMARSGAAYVLDKGLSLLFLIIIAAFGTTYYMISFSNLIWLLPVVLVTLVILITIFFKVWKAPNDGLLAKIHSAASSFLHHFWSFRHHWPIVLLNFNITILKWVILTFCYWTAFHAFNSPVPLLAAATIPVISTLVGYIPITVAGIGTVEWSAVLMFEMEGISKAAVLAVYLFFRVILYLLAGLYTLTTNVGDSTQAENTPEFLSDEGKKQEA